jgi:arsenate reductase
MNHKRRILFLCTTNSCPSQMAEGLVRHLYRDIFNPFSAAGKTVSVRPLAVKIMAEIGIDISKQKSKSIKELFSLEFYYVITLCGENAKDICPVFPGKAKQRLNWDFLDPADAKGKEEEVIQVFRKVEGEIKTKIDEFVKQLNK